MEIITEMAGGAVGNPLSSEEQPAEAEDEEDTSWVSMPDFFAPLRPVLMNAEGQERLLVRWGAWIALFGIVVNGLQAVFGSTVNGDGDDTNIERFQSALGGAVYCGGSVYLPIVCTAIRERTGALSQLKEDSAGAKLVTPKQVQGLKRWRSALLIPAAGFSIFALAGPGSYFAKLWLGVLGVGEFREFLTEQGHIRLLYGLPVMLSMTVGYPIALAWYFSMRVAVVLSADQVMRVVRNATRETLADASEWKSKVAKPAINLATGTMEHLSNGWGAGTGTTAALCAWISLANFVGIVHNISTGEDLSESKGKLAGCAISAIAPFIVAFETANVSTRCDLLMQAVNNLRLEWESDETVELAHKRTFMLQCTL
jgi:hypothetical protein